LRSAVPNEFVQVQLIRNFVKGRRKSVLKVRNYSTVTGQGEPAIMSRAVGVLLLISPSSTMGKNIL